MRRYVLSSPVGIFVQSAQAPALRAFGVFYTSDVRKAMSFSDEDAARKFAEEWKIPNFMKPAKKA